MTLSLATGYAITLWPALIVASFLAASGCASVPALPPASPSILVVPAGSAAAAELKARAQVEADQAAKSTLAAAALSQAAAAAGNVSAFNARQPPGLMTTGVADETGLIVKIAGPPTAADTAAAAQRRLIVLSGNLAAIQTAYAGAREAVSGLETRLAASQSDLAAARAAWAKSEARAQAESAQSATRLQAAFNAKQTEIDQARAAYRRVQSEAEKRQQRLEAGIFFGSAALCLVGGFACLFLASTYPLFGPRAGLILLTAAAGLAAFGVVLLRIQNFLDQHPQVFWWGLAGILALCAAAIALVFSNHWHHVSASSVPPSSP